MALAASPPPPAALTAEQEAESLQLDEEIAKVRAEITALTQRRSRLTSTLLSSTAIQSRLRQHPNLSKDPELTALLDQHSQHTQRSAYRLAFGVTAFPFIDPSPDTSNVALIGVRIDVCKRNGQFESPYYVLCKRVNDEGSELRVHRHSIPALVPLGQYEEKYLPLSDEGYGSEDSVLGSGSRQDLDGFVRAVRKDLVAWQLRRESIELIREKLELPYKPIQDSEVLEDDGIEEIESEGKSGVVSVEPVAVDAHYARIVWKDGRVGRVKIGEDGSIQRAVVFGVMDGQNQRCTDIERILVAEDSRIDTLVDRLNEIHDNREFDK